MNPPEIVPSEAANVSKAIFPPEYGQVPEEAWVGHYLTQYLLVCISKGLEK